ncbi:MAG: hypothetical protein GQ470_06990 [Gammaproteobacteria bacterium]|nr:hypothetical protein [Gammaproteobacteria bacterium]
MELFDEKYDDEGMKIFIGNLPDKATAHDIDDLLGEHIADERLKFSHRLFMDGSSTNFCVASFSSRTKGEKAMSVIQDKKLGGRRLTIHKFYNRHYRNDRRLSPCSSEYVKNLRSTDRRREEAFVLQSVMCDCVAFAT